MIRLKYLCLLFFIVLISACKSGFDGTKLDCTIAHAEGKLLLLEDIAVPEKVIVDSTYVVEGKAQFKVYINDGIYRLREAESNAMVFLYIEEGNELKLDWDLKEPEKYKISGSQESADLKKIVRFATRSSKEYAVLENALKMSAVDTAITRQAMRMNREKLSVFVDKMSDSIPNADVASFALNYASLSPDNLQFMIKKTADIHKKNPQARYAKMWYDTFDHYRDNLLSQVESGLKVGDVAPEIILPGMKTPEVVLSSLRGKYVLLDFWASWCQPCRKENPNLLEAFKRYRNRNFTIFSVSLDSKKEQLLKGIEVDKLAWRNHGSDFLKWRSPIVTTYDIKSIPVNYLLDTNGVIIAKNVKGEALLALLDATLPQEKDKTIPPTSPADSTVTPAKPVVNNTPSPAPATPRPAVNASSTTPPVQNPARTTTSTVPSSAPKPASAPAPKPNKPAAPTVTNKPVTPKPAQTEQPKKQATTPEQAPVQQEPQQVISPF